MSKTYRVFLLIGIIILQSCDDVEVVSNPTPTGSSETYTIQGYYINGTTNVPYSNVELELLLDNYGYPLYRKLISGPIKTDQNGFFKFTYSKFNHGTFGLYLRVRNLEIYKNIEYIPIHQNLDTNVYMSDFGKVELRLVNTNPDNTIEKLFIKISSKGDIEEIIPQSDDYCVTLKSLPLNTTVMWGRTLQELDDAINNKNTNRIPVLVRGDPYIEKVTLSY